MLIFISRAALVVGLSQAAGLSPRQDFSRVAPRPGPGSTPADSARIVRGARSAQSSFELFRRNRLPVVQRSSGPCDVRVGRYCYWRGDGDDGERPPAEALSIQKRRDELIRTLESASMALPGDAWIAGQRVRYLVEAERTDDALRFAASACRAGVAWCSALAGYAAHVAGRFPTADSAYSVALAAMDSSERCRWLDISDLLPDELEHRFKVADCSSRELLARRLFWLGAPLLSVSETDLRTEHLSRQTRARMAERSATVDAVPWGDDVRELIIRYGWSRWYSRSLAPMGSMSEPSYTGHDAGTLFDFLPNAHALDHVGHAVRDDWNLDDPRASTGYAPSFARSVHDVPSQIAAFRRGDSTLVVAAWDARRDTTLLGRSLDAALVLAGDAGHRTLSRLGGAGTVGRISVVGMVDSGLVSLELLAREDRRAARARIGIPARERGRVAVSDLLLDAPSANGTPPTELAAAIDSALASSVVPRSRGLGVYWEMYGLRPEGEAVKLALSVEQIDVGWIHHAAVRLGLADPRRALRIQWEESPQSANGVAGRGVRVDLSALRSGRYWLQLIVTPNGEAPAVASREIEVP